MILFAAMIATGCAEAVAEPDYSFPDTVQITGIFAGYELGDYYYAVFIDDEGYMQTAFPPGASTPGLDVFLFRHRGSRVVATAVNRQFDLLEAGHMIVPVIIDAWTPDEDYSHWYSEVCSEHGVLSSGEFHDLFGDPIETEELFDVMLFVNGSP